MIRYVQRAEGIITSKARQGVYLYLYMAKKEGKKGRET